MSRWGFLVLVLGIACAATLSYQGEPYIPARNPNVYVSLRAKRSLDSLFNWSVAHQVETGACIPAGDYTIRVQSDGTTTFWIRGITSGTIVDRYPAMVTWGGSLCGDTLPSIHTHWLDNGSPICPTCQRWAPSPIDIQTALDRPRIPFHMIVMDTGRYFIFTVRR